MTRKSGFTLVELLIVTVIIAILAGLSIPRFKNTFNELKLKNTSYNIYKLIQFARERAAVEGKSFRVHFDFENASLELLEWQGPSGEAGVKEAEPTYRRAQGRFGKKIKLPEGISLKGSREDVDCFVDGHCNAAEIHVLGQDSGYELSVLPGGVKIKEIQR